MNLNLGLIDLSSVVAMVVSAGIVSSVLSGARTVFLDRLLSGVGAIQRDYILRIISGVLNFLAILGYAVFAAHYTLDLHLLVSAVYYALGGFGLGHLGYHLAVNTKANVEPAYPEIPDGEGLPPTDAPQSAALSAAA